MKHNIRNLEATESDSILKQLQPVRFQWNRNDTEDIGFIAQDVESIFPEAVGSTSVGLTISYNKFIPLLVETVKTLENRVSSLEETIEEIKRRLP
jgi:hypothetical protein